ncbi:unnamed protein product [Parnassius apollo]|uniref:(apollo) hypothetical protein n=1 Tax=Parnassius apollo TaxID=110799 RepID=A0A8S3VY02_PARAO|nr:unnamed protein product [Parnassius apollo]
MGTSGSLESNTCTQGVPAEELATSGSSESNTFTTLNSTDGTAEHETWGFGDAMMVVKRCFHDRKAEITTEYVDLTIDNSYSQNKKKHVNHICTQLMDSNSQFHLNILEGILLPMMPSNL